MQLPSNFFTKPRSSLEWLQPKISVLTRVASGLFAPRSLEVKAFRACYSRPAFSRMEASAKRDGHPKGRFFGYFLFARRGKESDALRRRILKIIPYELFLDLFPIH